jgi:hypothetical protein
MAIQIIADQIKNGEVTNDKLAGSIQPAKIDLSQVFGFTAIPTINATPTAANQIVSKQYVDNKLQGLSWHDSVRVRSSSNIDISDAPATIDGISMVASDRVLLSAQSTGSENGIYVWSSAGGAMARAADADTFAELQSAAVFIREGTSADKGYLQSAELSSFASQSWILFSSTNGGRQAGDGLDLASNTLNVLFDNSSIKLDGSGRLKVKDSGVTNDMLAGSVSNSKLSNSSITVNAGSGLSGGGATALGASVTVAAAAADSSIDVGAGGISVANAGVTAAKLAANAVQTGNIVDANVTLVKVENVAAGKVIMGNASNRPTATAISGDIAISNTGAVTIQAAAVENSMLSGSIENAKLQNSAVTLSGGDGVSIASGAISLGGSKTVNLQIDGSSLSKSGSGLKIADAGVGSAQLADDACSTAKIPDSAVTNDKLASSSVSVVSGDGLQGGGSLSLGGTLTLAIDLDGSSLALDSTNGLSVAAGGIQTSMLAANCVNAAAIQNNAVGSSEIADDAVGSTELASNAVLIEKVGFRAYTESFSGTTNTKYDLGRAVNANFFDRVQVFRNGLRCKKVASPSDSSEYSVANDGTSSVCAVSFGSAPNGDSIIVDYLT